MKEIALIIFITILLCGCSKKSEAPIPYIPTVATLTASVMPSTDFRSWIVTIKTDTLFSNGLDAYVKWTDNADKLQYVDTLFNIKKYVISGTPKSFMCGFPGNGHISLSSYAINVKITGIKYYSNDFTFKY